MSDEQYTSTARTMFILVWLIIFAGLFMFFYFQGRSESTVHSSNQREYVLGADENGHYLIKGIINGMAVEFLVDTGASIVAIPQNVADRLHITGHYPMSLSTANGVVTGSLTRVEQLGFGAFSLNDVKAVIIPSSDDEVVLLGMNVLSHFNITQQDKRLILQRQDGN